jgi:hypothetical protein
MDQKRKALRPEEVNIGREIEYIVRRAQEREARLVSLGDLVLFSTQTGDAWILDPADGLALCLSRDGERQEVCTKDTPERFIIVWRARYSISGDEFTVFESEDRVRTILGYPTAEIVRCSCMKRSRCDDED